MAHQVILIPAYGKKYDSVSTCKLDWLNGKDFRIEGGSYCSIRDIDTLKRLNNHVLIKYSDGIYSEIFDV